MNNVSEQPKKSVTVQDKIAEIQKRANEEAPALVPHTEKVEVAQAIEIIDIKEWTTKDSVFSLVPQAPQHKRIKKYHPLTYPIKNLLIEEKVTTGLIDKITNNEYRDLYGYLVGHGNIHQAKVLEAVAKATKIPKVAIKKDFEDFVKVKNRAIADAMKAKQLKKYKKIFDTMEDIEMPPKYSVNDNFLEYQINQEEEAIVICKVFTIGTKILAKDRAYYEIKKVENNYQRTIVAPARDLTDSKRVALLFADTGEVFDSSKANLVTKFISEYTRLNEDKIDTKIGRINTGWNDNIYYLPQLINDCVWIDSPSQLESSFTTRGTLNNQVEMLRELSKGKAFLLSLASLSSSLYGVIEHLNLNYTIHIGGLRGDGKSLAVKTAVSLYGIPDISKYGRNWNATLSGIETYVERFKSVPSWCDELEASKNVADVITFMYSFSEGAGRARAIVKDGEVVDREIKTFKGILFSTGEKNIDEVITNMGKDRNIPLGVTRRVLDLKVDNLWDGIDRERVGDLLDENYGLFVAKWIDIIAQDKDLIKESFAELRKLLNWKLEGKEKLFYLMITVLRFLTKHHIINQQTYKIQFTNISELVEKERLDMIKNKDVASAFLDHASNFLAVNANNFIHTDEYASADINNANYGRIDEHNIAFISRVFKDICTQNGLVQTQVIDALKRSGLLVTSSNGSSTKVVRLYKGNTTRCYVIKKKALHPEEEKEQKSHNEIPIYYETIPK